MGEIQRQVMVPDPLVVRRFATQELGDGVVPELPEEELTIPPLPTTEPPPPEPNPQNAIFVGGKLDERRVPDESITKVMADTEKANRMDATAARAEAENEAAVRLKKEREGELAAVKAGQSKQAELKKAEQIASHETAEAKINAALESDLSANATEASQAASQALNREVNGETALEKRAHELQTAENNLEATLREGSRAVHTEGRDPALHHETLSALKRIERFSIATPVDFDMAAKDIKDVQSSEADGVQLRGVDSAVEEAERELAAANSDVSDAALDRSSLRGKLLTSKLSAITAD